MFSCYRNHEQTNRQHEINCNKVTNIICMWIISHDCNANNNTNMANQHRSEHGKMETTKMEECGEKFGWILEIKQDNGPLYGQDNLAQKGES